MDRTASQVQRATAEAYNAALLAEYELAEGISTRARRLAERSAHVAESRGLANLQAQALAVQAETVAAQGDRHEADHLMAAAMNAVTERGDDAWTNAYLLLTYPAWRGSSLRGRSSGPSGNVLKTRRQSSASEPSAIPSWERSWSRVRIAGSRLGTT